jgi:TrmH family RNA methyltransferase
MSENVLANLCVVMVETSHPGNIGSAARAMKTMGIHDLRLVAPRKPFSQDSWALASGANDVLEQAKIVPSLPEAIADCHIVIGASARAERSLQWPLMDARQCGEFVGQRLAEQKIALVFGRERSGLSNEELEYCQTLVHIPMAYDYISLNIAASIQVICYECAMAVRNTVGVPQDEEPLVTAGAMESFYQHLQQSLIQAQFLDPENPGLMMRRFRRLFGRSSINSSEMKLLRGMLNAFTPDKSKA